MSARTRNQYPSAMYTITYGKIPVRVKRISRSDEQADVFDQRSAGHSPISAGEYFFDAIPLHHEDLTRLDLRTFDLPDRQAGHFG